MTVDNQENAGYLLYHLTMILERKMKQELDKLDLTHTQFVMLASLKKLSLEQEFVTQIDIANFSNTDRMMVSKVLRTLETKSFVSRNEHQTDTRAKTILFTAKGNEIFKKAYAKVKEFDTNFFACLQSKTQSFKNDLNTLISNHQ